MRISNTESHYSYLQKMLNYIVGKLIHANIIPNVQRERERERKGEIKMERKARNGRMRMVTNLSDALSMHLVGFIHD